MVPWLPSSVAATSFSFLQSFSSSSMYSNSSFVFAPIMKVSFDVLGSFFAKKSNGAMPVPPPTIRTLPFLIVKLLPKGPRTPIVSPVFMRCNAAVASPTFLRATETFPFFSALAMLRGISSTLGIQSIRNCPGFAFAHCLSLNAKVFTVELSVLMLRIWVVLSWLLSVR